MTHKLWAITELNFAVWNWQITFLCGRFFYFKNLDLVQWIMRNPRISKFWRNFLGIQFWNFRQRVIRSRISIFKKWAQNSYMGGFRGDKSPGKKVSKNTPAKRGTSGVITFRGGWPASANWMSLRYIWIKLPSVGKWCSTDVEYRPVLPKLPNFEF